MIEIDDIIELQTNTDTEKLYFKTQYLVYENFTFELSVISERFSGFSHFCVRRNEIEELCSELSKMYNYFKGSASLYNNDSDSYIKFEIEQKGHIIVSGQVGGSHEDHSMKFRFETDQTCIPKLIQDFNKLLQHKYT